MVFGHFMVLDSSETPQEGCGEESVSLWMGYLLLHVPAQTL